MLQKETVSEPTLELLKTLMNDKLLQNFFLVGGTALALQIGHRISIDLDLFSTRPFDKKEILYTLIKQYNFKLNFESGNALKGEIDHVKVDLITHQYPLINLLIIEEGIRMASLEDIAAMKLNAIVGNGTRVKDFIDIAYLSAYLTPIQMVEAYESKYSSNNPIMAIKALNYYRDIDFNEDVEMIDVNYSWEQIEERLKQMLDYPEYIFEPINKPNRIDFDDDEERNNGFTR
jgi:hypothetical protein